MTLTSGWWRQISAATLRADFFAGILGAVLVLPQAIAFATLAGLPPQYGIYSAIVPTIVAAIFGSSWHVVSGPTNANSLALFAALSPLALAGSPEYIVLALCVTIMVGLIQFSVGALRLGFLTHFIVPSVLLGFSSGAALLIALYALGDFMGISAPAAVGTIGAVEQLFTHWPSATRNAIAIGCIALAVTFAARYWTPRMPFMLIGLVAGWAVSELLSRYAGGARVATVGAFPSVIPDFSFPLPPYDRFVQLLTIAPALALIALGQAVSIAKTVAHRSGQRLDVNREFIGQGLSNIAGGFFSSYLSCGSLNRSLPNLEAGARTPIAAILSAVFLLIFAAAFAPLNIHIPTPATAALLLYTAWALFDGAGFLRLLRLSEADFVVAATTFTSTLLLPFHVAIGIGTAMSLAVYLRRTSRPGLPAVVPDPESSGRPFRRLDEFSETPLECPQLKMVRMEGSVYYAAAPHLADELHEMRMRAPDQKHLLVMVKSMNFVDLTGADLWDSEMTERRKIGGDLYFHRPRLAVTEFWSKTGFSTRLGADHIFQSKTAAISSIRDRLDPEICLRCTARIFTECQTAAAPKKSENSA